MLPLLTPRLRRLATYVLLLTLPLQALAAVGCALAGSCPLQMQQQVAETAAATESGCHHAATAAPADDSTQTPSSMDHCPLMAAPAMLTDLNTLPALGGCNPQLPLLSGDFHSADPHGLLRPPRHPA